MLSTILTVIFWILIAYVAVNVLVILAYLIFMYLFFKHF